MDINGVDKTLGRVLLVLINWFDIYAVRLRLSDSNTTFLLQDVKQYRECMDERHKGTIKGSKQAPL